MTKGKKPKKSYTKEINAGAFAFESMKGSGNPLLTPRKFSWEGEK